MSDAAVFDAAVWTATVLAGCLALPAIDLAERWRRRAQVRARLRRLVLADRHRDLERRHI